MVVTLVVSWWFGEASALGMTVEDSSLETSLSISVVSTLRMISEESILGTSLW